MKSSLVTAALLTLLVAANCQAITLKLDPEIDMLVLDGRKISGSLLRGAASLELERGEHQFLFRVEKIIDPASKTKQPMVYQSAPMIVTFSAEAKSIRIRLPALDNHQQRFYFNRNLDFQMIDEQGKVISSKRDRLELTAMTNAEQAMGKYNSNGGIASVPRFARLAFSQNLNASLPEVSLHELSDTPLLRQWLKQINSAVRQRLPGWIRALTAS